MREKGDCGDAAVLFLSIWSRKKCIKKLYLACICLLLETFMSNIRSTGKKSSNTLVRDLVNVGIFSALYIVLGFMSSSIGYIPALIVFSTASIALVTSVPMFLFYSKIERPILCCMLFCGIFGGAMLVMGQSINFHFVISAVTSLRA